MTDWTPIDYSKIDLTKIDWSAGIEEIPDDDVGAQANGKGSSGATHDDPLFWHGELDPRPFEVGDEPGVRERDRRLGRQGDEELLEFRDPYEFVGSDEHAADFLERLDGTLVPFDPGRDQRVSLAALDPEPCQPVEDAGRARAGRREDECTVFALVTDQLGGVAVELMRNRVHRCLRVLRP